MTEDQQIGFGGGSDEEGEMPPEMKEHMLKAFAHAAGLGPHPGMYKGPPRRRRDPDEITDTDRQRAEEEPLEDQEEPHEASYRKMQAAARGGALELGPSAAEQKQAQQQRALQQRAATQGQIQAAQAQAAQAPVAAPAAPTGPRGVEIPEPAQTRSQPPPEEIAASQQQQPPSPPAAPGPETATNP